MSWDTNTRAKRLNRKQKKVLTWLSFIVAAVFVLMLGLWDDFEWKRSLATLADSLLSEDEKRTIWEGMSEDGKDIIRRHTPAMDE